MSKNVSDASENQSQNDNMILVAIDVGGNSVSMEVRSYENPYKKEKDLPQKIKKFCALAQGIEKTGEIKQEACLEVIHIIDDMSMTINDLRDKWGYIPFVTAIGTAPFRDSTNGKALARAIELKTGIPIEIISGDKEAQYAAKGVLTYHPNLKSGMVMDTGGGSTEFAIIEDGKVTDTYSIPLGMQRIAAIEDPKEKEAFIREQLAKLPEKFRQQETVIATGGINRTIAKAYAKKKGFKIKRGEDEHIVSAKKYGRFIEKLSEKSPDKLTKIFQKKGERAKQIFDAKLMGDITRDVLGVQNIILSKANVRDGIRAEQTEAIERYQNIMWTPKVKSPNKTRKLKKEKTKKEELKLAVA